MLKKLAALAAAGLILLAGAFLWVRSWLTPAYLRARIDEQVAEVYAGKFSFGEVAYAFPLSVRVDQVVVADPSGKDEYLRVASAAASLEPWALLSKEVHVTSFVLREPSVLLVLDAANQPVMLRHLKLGASSEASSGPAVALAVAELRVEAARLVVRGPAAPPLDVHPLDARLSLLGEVLTLHEMTLTAHGPVAGALRLSGRLEALLSAPQGPLELSSAGLSLQAPDPALAPIRTGPLAVRATVKDAGLLLESLRLELWQGAITGQGAARAGAVDLKGAITGVRVGEWLGPMLLARGLGEPLPQLSLDVREWTAGLTGLTVGGVRLVAGGLQVAGDVALTLAPQGPRFGDQSKLAGTFAGGDLARALALPGTELDGDLTVAMSLKGLALAPRIAGTVAAPALTIRRPGVLSLPVTALAGEFSFADSVVKVPKLGADLVGGHLDATATADLGAVPPTYGFALTGARFRIPKLFEAMLVGSPFAQGELDLTLDLRGAGSDPKGLVGEGRAAIRTARLAANQVTSTLAQKLKEPSLAEPELDGKFKLLEVSGGRVRLGDFAGQNGKLGPVQGDGSVGFDGTLEGKVTWKVPLNSPDLPAVLRGRTLPVTLAMAGTTAAPQMQLQDVGQALQGMVEEEAAKRLAAEKAKAQAKVEAKVDAKVGGVVDKLLGKLGGGAAPAPAPAAASATSTAPAPAPTADLKQELGDKAKGLLKGLFR